MTGTERNELFEPREVTARAAAERALRAAKRYLLAVFRNVPGALWMVDRDLRIVCAFGSVDAITASEANTLEGRTIPEMVAAHSVTEPAVAHHLAALAGQRQAFGYTFRGRLFQITVEPLVDGERGVSGCVGTAIDITHG